MRTLILGGTGMLGRAVVEQARQRGWPALGPSRAQLSIEDGSALRAVARSFQPQLIVNCAAFTKVDECETRRERALAVNGTALDHVVAVAAATGAQVVQVSSDYVFDGAASVPYAEGAAVAPLSVYGESKLLGERRALLYERALVLRTSWLFGPGGPNFMATMLGLFERNRRDGTAVRVVTDQVGCPTYTPFLAAAICDAAARRLVGVVHYRNRDAVSWHGFAAYIARAAGTTLTVEPVSTAGFPRPARRPAYSVLDVTRFEAALGRPVETWSAGVELYLDLIRRRKT